MPAKSKQQQKFMGIVRAIQKGEQPAGKFSKAAQKAAKSMKKGSVRKYAKTKHDDLPKKVKEEKKRDYKAEYKKFQSSTKSKKYRAELNKYNRKKGTYGNGDGKDASHKGGKIVGFESQSKNRGRAEKSRLKKEAVITENPAVIATAARMAIQNAQGKKVSVNTARQTSYAKKDPSAHKKAKSIFQRIKDKFKKKDKPAPKKQSKSDVDFYKRQFTGEVKEGPDDVRFARRALSKIAKHEANLRKSMFELEQAFLRDPRQENQKLAKDLKKNYKDGITKFMRDSVQMIKRMK